MKITCKHLILTLTFFGLTLGFMQNAVIAAVPMLKNAVGSSKLDGGAYIVFAGKTGGKITKKELESQTKLALNGCPGASESTIVSFKLEISKGGKITTYSSSSDKLTAEMVTALKSLSNGDSFDFKKVMAHLPTSKNLFEAHTQKFFVSAQGV